MKKKILILGGGASGLAAAYALMKKGHKPTVIEKESALGGLASSYKIGSFDIDKYYHHIFKTDTALLGLIKELELDEKLIWKKTRMGIYYKDKLYNFTTPLDLLLFKPLSITDRLKFGINVLKAKKSAHNLDNTSAERWIIDKWGYEIYEKIFKPLLRTKFGMSMDKASAAFVFGRVKARASSRSGSMMSEKLGYVNGSFQAIIDKLEERLRENGCRIITQAEITELKKNKQDFELAIKENNKTKKITAQCVISTLPLPILSKILKNFEKELLGKIRKIEYQGVICAVIGLKSKLSNLYWINANSDKVPFGGVIEHTNFIPAEHYNGQHIIYVFNYIGQNHRYWKMPDREIMNEYSKGLSAMFKNFKKEDILWHRVSRTRFATPLFTMGYGKSVEELNKPFHGLHFAGSFLVYPESRNINSIISTSFNAVKNIK